MKFIVRDEADYLFAVTSYEYLKSAVSPEALARTAFILQPMDAVGLDTRDALLDRLRWLQETVQARRHWFFRPLPQTHVLIYGVERRAV